MLGQHDLVALVAKHIANQVAGGGVVVDDQDLSYSRTLERSGQSRNFDGRRSAVEANIATHKVIDAGAVREAQARMLTPRSAREAARVIMCICDPTRLKIVRALQATELAAGDLALVIERSRSATSHHLRILRDASAVRSIRQRNVIRYRLSEDLSGEVLDALGSAFDRLSSA
jgi:DNA-binding transcriptional ArsR family regulator